MKKYFISVKIDCRIDVDIEASSFEEAFEKAIMEAGTTDLATAEVVGMEPVHAKREDETEADYGYHPYPR